VQLAPIFPVVARVLEIDDETFEDMNPGEDRKYRASVSTIEDGVLLFMRSFYRQFFFYGYALDFPSLDKNSIARINAIPQATSPPRPDHVIQSVNDFVVNVSGDLVTSGYGGSMFAPRTVICTSLFNLMKAFIKDGEGVFDNYEEIAAEAKKTMTSITSICQ
jgi:hypothetical protein